MKIVSTTYDHYSRAVRLILPKGRMWRADASTFLGKLTDSISYEMARFHNRLIDFMAELTPATADETIEDWEEMYGLPDVEGSASSTLADRQAALAAKVRAKGGQSPEYFERVLAALGITITVTTNSYTPAMCGVAVCGYSACGGFDSNFYWTVTGSVPSAQRGQVEAVINKYKPAHTHVLFVYT